MAFSFGGAAGGAVSGGTAGASFGPIGAGVGAVAGGLLGGFLGGDKGPRGGQIKAEELSMELARLGISDALTQKDLFQYLVGGGPFQGSTVDTKGGSVSGAFGGTAPTGPAFNLVQGGLQGEEALSRQRQSIAQQLLGNYGQDLGQARQFGLQQLGLGQRALPTQERLFGDQFDQSNQNFALNRQLTGQIGDFFQSGGGPSDAQRTQIGGIFDAQRQIGQSNLNQQYGEALRQLQDHATTRGLRFNDTPIQDRGNLTTQEFLRNAANLEASLGGQQANALLNAPLQQAQFGANLMGNLQNSNLNTINAFSLPINNAFNQQGAINSGGQFGLQFSPATYSGGALQNFGALLNGGGFTQGVSSFSPSGFAQNQPGFGTNLLNNFGAGLGGAVGKGAGGAINAGINNLFGP